MTYREELFGIMAIWIMIFHVFDNVGGSDFLPLKILFRIVSKGNMGVDVFLFLSAIGLCFSMQKNTVSSFYINRVKRVLVPYLIISTPYYVWYNFIYADKGLIGFLGDVSTANFWITGDFPVWYVAFIIVLYALFPVIYQLDRKTRHISTVCLMALSSISEYWLYASRSFLYINAEKALSRVPIFLFGICIAPFVLSKKRIAFWKVAAAFFIGSGLFVFLCIKPFNIVLTRYMYGVIGVCLMIVYGFFREHMDMKRLGRVLVWVGGISFEIYIVHMMLIRTIRFNEWWDVVPSALWYAIIPILTILLAKLVSLVCRRLFVGSEKKQRREETTPTR